jgi:hypothetical protein
MRRASLAAAFLALAAATGATQAADAKEERARRGLAIAPVKLDLKGKDQVLVGLGSDLVNATGGCHDCHTAPPYAKGGDPFLGEKKRINTAGYLAGGTPFGPGIVSTNLTPDAKGLPGGMSFKQFKRAMRFGQDPEDPTRRLQVMPWPSFQNLTDHALKAIYAYLSAIPHAETPAPARS